MEVRRCQGSKYNKEATMYVPKVDARAIKMTPFVDVTNSLMNSQALVAFGKAPDEKPRATR